MNNVYQVLVKTLPQDAPLEFETSAALLVASYFKTDVVFLRPTSLKTPDLKVRDEIWELKSPRGNSKNTIHNVFITSRKQSNNIVIDLRRCKMNEQKAFSRIRDAYNKRRQRQCKLKIITKRGRVVDISELL